MNNKPEPVRMFVHVWGRKDGSGVYATGPSITDCGGDVASLCPGAELITTVVVDIPAELAPEAAARSATLREAGDGIRALDLRWDEGN